MLRESSPVARIIAMIKRRGGWAEKQHGSLFGHIKPDIYACYRGHMLAIEVKRPRPPAVRNVSDVPKLRGTRLQQRALEQWGAAGALTLEATSVAEVEALLRRIDEILAA